MVPMKNFDERNVYFDTLVNSSGLIWMSQNTNHATAHPHVTAAIAECVARGEFHLYAPPLGLEKLRQKITQDLGGEGLTTVVTDGGVSGLYHLCRSLLGPGDELLTTDPTWKWPLVFAKDAGARTVQIPIYDPSTGYKPTADLIEEHISERTKIVYLVDPNNPLGSTLNRTEWKAIVAVLKRRNVILIQDCTYREFAQDHFLASELYRENTITITSFSKWLGLAGLRVGALTGPADLVEKIAGGFPNSLGSSVLAQRAAIAGLEVKAEWFPPVLEEQRRNQKEIKKGVDQIEGLSIPIYPSNGNFLIIECEAAGVVPEALCAAYRKHDVLIRQGAYHSGRFGHRFVKVSTSVPADWADKFVRLLPEMISDSRKIGPVPNQF